MPSGIYKITNSNNGKYYIGSSKDIIQRFACHKSLLRKGRHPNPHLQNSWNNHGEEVFTFAVLEECPATVVDLETLEQKYIDESWQDKGRLLYNQRRIAASNLGCRFSDAARANMSKARTGKKQSPEMVARRAAKAIGHKWNLGWKPSEENLKNMRAAAIAKKRAVVQRTLQGEYVTTYPSARDASYAMGQKGNAVARACRDKNVSAGHLWHYEDLPFVMASLHRKGTYYQVEQLSLTGELLAVWPNARGASVGTGIGQSGISHCCYGRKKQSNGFIWRFIEPEIN